MLAIARGLISRPQLLLLDEPSLGLSPKMVNEIFKVIAQLRDRNVTILLAEQNVFQAFSVAHKAAVMQLGRVVDQGSVQNLINKPTIRQAYLGE